MTYKLWTRTLALNVTALAMACTAAGRVMREQRSGPHRQHHLARLAHGAARLHRLRGEQGRRRFDHPRRRGGAGALSASLVNSLAPGMMDTEMQRSTEAELARVNGRNDLQAFLDERTRRVPLGRRAEIAEVAEAVVWLCLDAPTYMTAERLNMSGGLDKD